MNILSGLANPQLCVMLFVLGVYAEIAAARWMDYDKGMSWDIVVDLVRDTIIVFAAFYVIFFGVPEQAISIGLGACITGMLTIAWNLGKLRD